MEDVVYNEQTTGPVHNRRIHFVSGARRPKSWHKGKKEGQRVQTVHAHEVPLGSLFKSSAGSAGKVAQNDLESHKIYVICAEDQQKERGNYLFRQVENKEQNEDCDVNGKHYGDHSTFFIFAAVVSNSAGQKGADHRNFYKYEAKSVG